MLTGNSYHFKIPSEIIWTSHILIGLFLIYVGYSLLVHKKLQPFVSITLVVLGVLALLYHAHIWFYDYSTNTKYKI